MSFILLCSDFNNFCRAVSHQSYCCFFEGNMVYFLWFFKIFLLYRFPWVSLCCTKGWFLYINLGWSSLSFLCFLSLQIVIFHQSGKYLVIIFSIRLIFSPWNSNYMYIRWNDLIPMSLMLFCHFDSSFFPCFSLYTFPLNCPLIC